MCAYLRISFYVTLLCNPIASLPLLLLLLLLSHFSCVRLCATPETAAHQAPPSLGFSRQEHWSGLPFLLQCMKSESEVSLPLEQTKSAEAGVSVRNHTRPSVLSGRGSGDQREVQIRMRDGGEMGEESSNLHAVRVSHYKLFFFSSLQHPSSR